MTRGVHSLESMIEVTGCNNVLILPDLLELEKAFKMIFVSRMELDSDQLRVDRSLMMNSHTHMKL